MAGGYDYLNARVRGMMGRLVPEEALRGALSVPDPAGWMALLRRTPYEPFLGTASAGSEKALLFESIDRGVAARTNRLSRWGRDKAGRAIAAVLAEWDLANLLSLLSGVLGHHPPAETLTATLAGGRLGADQLAVLARARDGREMADRLATWGYPFHAAFRPALGKRGEHPSLTTVRLELVRRFHALLDAEAKEIGDPVLSAYLAARVDGLNLSTAFLWRSLPMDRGPDDFFLPGGRKVTPKVFQRVLVAPSVDQAVEQAPASFRPALAANLVAYEAERRLSVFSQALERLLFRDFTRAGALDPLDLSLPLAFILRLRREGTLLKLGLARLALGIPPQAFLTVAGDV